MHLLLVAMHLFLVAYGFYLILVSTSDALVSSSLLTCVGRMVHWPLVQPEMLSHPLRQDMVYFLLTSPCPEARQLEQKHWNAECS